MKKVLLDIPISEWPKAVEELGEKSFRAAQLSEWIFKKKVRDFKKMTDLPQGLRDKLEAEWVLHPLEIDGVAKSKEDGTTRFFMKTADGEDVSCVYLPIEARRTLCISTQVGCAWNCAFCASGLVKFKRNLTAGEILDQIFRVEEVIGKNIDGFLFMGMGEPLANYDNLVQALWAIRSQVGLHVGSRNVTVSTCGLVPQIEKLALEAPKVCLALSLHSAHEETRKKLLPKSSKWTIKEVLRAVKAFSKQTKARVTFEYIVIDGVNDSDQDAKRLANLLRGLVQYGDYRVNLISYNPVPGLSLKKPKEKQIEKFQEILKDRNLHVSIRKPRGVDIGAGCGQLGEATS